MCLTINKTIKERGWNVPTLEVLLNKFSKISNKNITVYKVLIVSSAFNTLLHTPHQYTPLNKDGDILISDDLSFYDRYQLIDIYRGIHAYTSLEKAKRVIRSYSNRIIVKSIIPAGTPYIIGTRDDIVSFMLFIPPVEVKFNKQKCLTKKYFE